MFIFNTFWNTREIPGKIANIVPAWKKGGGVTRIGWWAWHQHRAKIFAAPAPLYSLLTLFLFGHQPRALEVTFCLPMHQGLRRVPTEVSASPTGIPGPSLLNTSRCNGAHGPWQDSGKQLACDVTAAHRSWESAKGQEHQLTDWKRVPAPRHQRGPEARFPRGKVLRDTGCRGSSLASLPRAKKQGCLTQGKIVGSHVLFSFWFICRIEVWPRLLWF